MASTLKKTEVAPVQPEADTVQEEKKTGLYQEKEYKISLPLTREHQEDVTVIVNGMSYKIQRGKEVVVPAAVYEVLMNSMRMDELALMRQRELENGNL